MKKIRTVTLPPGPYATHFQEYSHDKLFKGTLSEKDTYTQRPRVSLGDFLANRLRRAVPEGEKDELLSEETE